MFRLVWALIIATAPVVVVAQAPPQSAPRIFHQPPDPNTVPPPGTLISLTAEVLNSREINHRMSAIVSLDGKLMQVPLRNRYLNYFDRPEFLLSIHAPQATLVYRFLLHTPDGKVEISPRYEIRRACVADTSITPPTELEKLQGEQRLNALVASARNLKLRIEAYATAQALLEKIQQLLTE